MLRFWARLIGNNSIFWTQITILKLEKAIVHWPPSSSQTHLRSSLALCLYKSRPQLTVFSGFGEVSPREETGRQEEVNSEAGSCFLPEKQGSCACMTLRSPSADWTVHPASGTTHAGLRIEPLGRPTLWTQGCLCSGMSTVPVSKPKLSFPPAWPLEVCFRWETAPF